jgi:hypothetical protein
MFTANTLTVRNLVQNVLGVSTFGSWTDKCKDENMRLVAFHISDDLYTDEFKQKVIQMFRDVGYDNRVTITKTGSKVFYQSGGTYLRIKATFKA